jgi:CRP/FNR family transcriptional regulator, cyclic AMP receptor protein
MATILDSFDGFPERRFAAGEVLMAMEAQSGHMFVLISGAIEVVKKGVQVDFVREPGAVFGEISALLEVGHSAEVRAAEDSRVYVIAEPRQFLIDHPEVHLHVSELLARRVNNLVQYLSDVREQFVGHDHLGMVDQVLDRLTLRQARRRAVTKPPPEER